MIKNALAIALIAALIALPAMAGDKPMMMPCDACGKVFDARWNGGPSGLPICDDCYAIITQQKKKEKPNK